MEAESDAPAWGLGGSAGSWSSRAFSEKGEDRGGKRGWEQGWSRGGGGGPEAHPPPCRPGSGSENGTWLEGRRAGGCQPAGVGALGAEAACSPRPQDSHGAAGLTNAG